MSKKAKVGLLVAILCAIMLGLSPTQQRRAPILGTQYKLAFHRLEGLKVGDNVVLGGVPAGRVVGIDFAPRDEWGKLNPGQPDVPIVLVTVAMQGLPIPDQSAYKIIGTLKGQHLINIIPGPPGSRLQANAVLNRELEPEVEDYLEATFRNFKTLAKETEDMRKQFSDPQFRRDLKDSASNARFYSHEFLSASQNATGQVKEVSRQIDIQERQLLEQTAKMDGQVAAAQGYIKKVVPSARGQLQQYRTRLVDAQKQLDSILTKADKANEQLAKLANGFSPDKLNNKKIATDARNLAQKLEDISNLAGDFHAITSDQQVRKDLKSLFKKAKTSSETLKANVKKYDEMLDNYKWLIVDDKEQEHNQDP